MVSLNPVQIFSRGAEEEKAETARLSSFVGAIAIGDLVKSTLGPKGMDKILQSMGRSEKIQVTNDGATILRSIGVDNPAAKVLVDISKTQDDEVGDGTTSVVVLACELLREAETLVSKRIHPQTIIAGWRLATDEARKALTAFARDHGSDPVKFREDLINIARTTISSKILTQYKEMFAELSVNAVMRLKGSVTAHMLYRSSRSWEAGSRTLTWMKFYITEKEKMKDKLFADAGVMAIEHADFEGVERLALVTGGEIYSTFDSPETALLGQCDLIEEIIIGEDRLLKFSGVKMGEACTVVLRGATQQILDEAERSLHDALCVLTQTVKETKTVFGGGSSEMLMADAVLKLAAKTPGKEAVAMESFARALRMIPAIISDNGGYDSSQLISELRAVHTEGKHTYGIDMELGEIGDMEKLGITESFQVKRQVLISASEAAEMILRVDDIVKAAPRQREPDHRDH
ncbi:hypothetical protein DPMN_052626 [Dreissena polymorpha]|uniref:CCT-beta n=1 Tax=Dreissena polymorpha TaxID=45954 RepID=A0A9D4CLM0_DREPO|nr:hypothetical protein DPMN_052626 [Dreissena polymorpha]